MAVIISSITTFEVYAFIMWTLTKCQKVTKFWISKLLSDGSTRLLVVSANS